jgi:tetratricopeptide (TPR) repeat protein
MSFWDCGEFLASASILGNPHPPGNPLFMLLGKVFMLSIPLKELAIRMNFLSALAASLTILMVYLFTVKFLRILFREGMSRFAIYTGGVIAAFLVTFCDTFWFSAVEAEMYTLSMLVVMLLSWLSLYWYENRGTPRANRTIILIAYIGCVGMGVSHFAFITMPVIGLFLIISDVEIRSNIPLMISGLALLSMLYDIGNFVFYAVGATVIGLVGLLLSKAPKWRQRWSLATWVAVVGLLGASVYLYVPIRSATNPDIDEGGVAWTSYDAQSLLSPGGQNAFKDYLERKQYGSESMIVRAFHRRGLIQNQFLVHPHMGYGGYLLAQYFPWKVGESSAEESEPVVRHIFGKRVEFSTLTLLLQTHPQVQFLLFLLLQFPFLYGGYLVYKRNRQLGILVLTLYAITSLGMIFYMNFADGTQMEMRDYDYWKSVGFDPNQKPPPVHIEVRDRDYFFTPAFMYMGILFGLSSAFFLQWVAVRRKTLVRPVGFTLLALSAAVPVWSNFHEHNRSGDYVPWDYAYNLLMSCRPNSILFTNGDNDTFPLWFLQEAEGIRKDVRVVNLSLANTNWYLQQLRDHEPALKIGFTRDEIDALEPQPWRFKDSVEIKLPNSKIDYFLQRMPYLKVQDIMVLHIIQNNYPEHPIHFAITVGEENEMGLDKFTIMEGMVYTLVEDPKDKEIDIPRTTYLVDSVYKFRGLGDPKVYIDLNTQGLLTNYSSTDFRLAMWAHDSLMAITQELTALHKVANPSDSVKARIARLNQERTEKLAFAEKYLALNAHILPSEWRVYYYAGQLYSDIGETQKAEEAYQTGLKESGPSNARVFAMNLAQLYAQEGNGARAESTVAALYAQSPDDFEAMYTLAQLYQRRGDLSSAINLMSQWLARNPSHQYAGAISQQIQQMAAQMRAPAAAQKDTSRPGGAFVPKS